MFFPIRHNAPPRPVLRFIRFVAPHQIMWPAKVRTPPCRFVARDEAGGWPSGGRGGDMNRAVGNREPPCNGASRVCTGLHGSQATSRLAKGWRNADCTWCILASCFTNGVPVVAYGPQTHTFCQMLPRLHEWHKPSPGMCTQDCRI